MKNNILLIACRTLFAAIHSYTQVAAITAGLGTSHPQAVLDVQITDKGSTDPQNGTKSNQCDHKPI